MEGGPRGGSRWRWTLRLGRGGGSRSWGGRESGRRRRLGLARTCAGGRCWKGGGTLGCRFARGGIGIDLRGRRRSCRMRDGVGRGFGRRRRRGGRQGDCSSLRSGGCKHMYLGETQDLVTFFRAPGPPVLTRLRLLMTSVLREMGRGRPCSFRNRPQALHRTEPDSSRRQSGVVLVVQFWHTGYGEVS